MKLCRACIHYAKRKTNRKERKEYETRSGKQWESLFTHTEVTALCDKHHIKATACSARRRAKKLLATPSWSNQGKINEVYKHRLQMQKATGVKYHVDHDIPLRGNNVSGLHVHTNLRVITASDNLIKGSQHEV